MIKILMNIFNQTFVSFYIFTSQFGQYLIFLIELETNLSMVRNNFVF